MNNILSPHIDPNKIFIINRSEIEGRWDAMFYNPKFKPISDRSFVQLKDLTKYIIHPPEYPRNFSENGVQLIRSQNVRPLGISIYENPVYFSSDFLQGKKVIKPSKGDVLVVRSGVNAGDTAAIENDSIDAIIGADTLLCKCYDTMIPKFLQVYFFTNFGKCQMVRHTTGATNKHLNSDNLGKVLVPLMDLVEQKACIEIYERGLYEKQQKESEADELLASIDEYLQQKLGITLFEQNNNLGSRIFTAKFSDISNQRFDPNYHLRIQYLLNHQCRYEFKPLKDLIVNTPQYGANEEAINGDRNSDIRYIRISDIDEWGNLKDDSWKTAINIDDKYLLNKDDILFARSGSVGRCYIHKGINNKSIFAGYLIRFVADRRIVNPNFLFYYCHSIIYKHWVAAIYRPAVQANINSEEYRSLPVPLPPLEKQNEIAEHIHNIREQAKQLQQEAQEILDEAKKQVEQIILGE